MRNSVILIGYMGCGKSTVGQRLAGLLDWSFLDTDAWIEEKEGMTIKEIFAAQGEAYFRDLETFCLKEFTGNKKIQQKLVERELNEKKTVSKGCVFSVGGGLPVREENRELLKEMGQVIYLKASPDTIYERLKSDTTRPLLQTDNPLQKIKDMLESREKKYQDAANFVICVDGKSISEILEEIQEIIG